ncbi:chromate transporter [Caloramator australicus]|uniref:Chromate transport protein n=1 Tax=Caloramator australicus RC3 TaxID=857293 RepID=I7J516_9CLOT|nr:chromate transporter [Caloramator australicus]CCJ33381.1 Chromate transport protein [Caloramator australicus RC3]
MILKLFLTFFKIGMFSFGGGYAMLPLIQLNVVNQNNWLSHKEFIDIVAISQVTPGPIAINCATYVGYKLAGIFGAISSTLGVSMPSVIIMVILTKLVLKLNNAKFFEAIFSNLRPTVIGLILAAAILVFSESVFDIKTFIVFLLSFVISIKYKVDPIILTILGGILGYIIFK